MSGKRKMTKYEIDRLVWTNNAEKKLTQYEKDRQWQPNFGKGYRMSQDDYDAFFGYQPRPTLLQDNRYPEPPHAWLPSSDPFFKSRYYDKYTERNIKDADIRGGLVNSIMNPYQVYNPFAWNEKYKEHAKRVWAEEREQEKKKRKEDSYWFDAVYNKDGTMNYKETNKALERMIKEKESKISKDGKSVTHEKPKRSLLDRVFSGLSAGLYMPMGGAYEASRKDFELDSQTKIGKHYINKGAKSENVNKIIRFLQGVEKGAVASNPFGSGNEEWKRSTRDMMDLAGLGKIGRNEVNPYKKDKWNKVRIIRDFLATASDLNKYKNKNKLSSEDIDNQIASRDINKESIRRNALMNPLHVNPVNVARGGTAFVGDVVFDVGNWVSLGTKELVTGTGRKVGGKTIPALDKGTAKTILREFGDDVTPSNINEIIRRVESLQGVRKGGRGLSFGAKNVPFLGKALDKVGLADKTYHTFVSSDDMRKLGDKIGISRGYNYISNAFKLGKIGSKFNTHAELQKLALDNPMEAGKTIKMLDMMKGRSKDFIQARVDILDYANKNLSNLSKESQQEIISLIENPEFLSSNIDNIPYDKLPQGKEFRQKIEKYIQSADDIEQAYEKEVNKFIKEYNLSKQQSVKAKADEINKLYTAKKKLDKAVNSQIKDNNAISKYKNDYNNIKSSINQSSNIDKVANKLDGKSVSKDVQSILDIIDGKITTRDIMREKLYSDTGFINELVDNFDNIQKYKNASNLDKFGKVEVLNRELFGGKKVVADSTYSHIVDGLFDVATNSKNPGEIHVWMQKNKHLLDHRATDVYEFLGKKFQYENFSKEVKEPIDKLLDKQKARGLYKSEKERLDRLIDIASQRDSLRNELFAMNTKEYKDFVLQHENSKLEDIMSSLDDSIMSAKRSKFVSDSEALRYAKESEMAMTSLSGSSNTNRIKNSIANEYFHKDFKDILSDMSSGDKTAKPKLDFIDREYKNHIKQYGNEDYTYKTLQDTISELNKEYKKVSKEFKNLPDNIVGHKTKEKLLQEKLPIDTKESISNYINKNLSVTFSKSGKKQYFDPVTGEILDKIPNVDDNVSRLINTIRASDDADKLVGKYYKDTVDDLGIKVTESMVNTVKGLETPTQAYYKLKTYQEALENKETFVALLKHEYGLDNLENTKKVISGTLGVDDKNVKIAEDIKNIFRDIYDLERENYLRYGKEAAKRKPNVMPHIMTEEGKKAYRELQNIYNVSSEDKGKIGYMLSDMFGVGGTMYPRKYGKWYDAGTIEEINRVMKDVHGIDNFLETELSKIYTTRLLNHNNALYEKDVAKQLMSTFGKTIDDIGDVRKGHKAVVMYSDLRKYLPKKPYSKDNLNFLKRIGIDKSVVEGYISPFIEVDANQIKNIREYTNIPIMSINSPLVNEANKLAVKQQSRNTNVLLKLYDKALHLYKLNTTTTIPGFHTRNSFGNMFNNYLDVGSEAVNPKNHKEALEIFRGSQGSIKTRSGKKISYEEIRQQMVAHGLLDSGYFTAEMKEALKDGKPFSLKGTNLNPLDSRKFVGYKLGGQLGGIIEGKDRVLNYVANLKVGNNFTQSAEHTAKFLFDYSDLTGFEQNVVKRILPFYTWSKKNIPLQLEMIFSKPEIYRTIGRTIDLVENSVPEEDRVDREFVSQFAQDWIQLPFKMKNKEGGENPVLFNPSLPYGNISRFTGASDAKSLAKNTLSRTSPFIKVPIELATNENIFFGNEIEKFPGQKVEAPGVVSAIGEATGVDTRISPKVKHVLNQIASLQSVNKFFSTEGSDRLVHGINTIGGFKISSYNYDKNKHYMLRDRLDNIQKVDNYEQWKHYAMKKRLNELKRIEEEKRSYGIR